MPHSDVPAQLGPKAMALAWPLAALAFQIDQPSRSQLSWLGSGLAQPEPWLLGGRWLRREGRLHSSITRVDAKGDYIAALLGFAGNKKQPNIMPNLSLSLHPAAPTRPSHPRSIDNHPNLRLCRPRHPHHHPSH